ncbi:MAG: Yip1 family protein [Bacteroidales bacterium]
MNFKKLYQRSRSLLIQPSAAWVDLSSENQLRRSIILDYLLPFSILIGISSLLGTLISEGIEDSFSFAYLILTGSISFLIIFLEVYLSGWLITEISLSFDPSINSHSIFKLVTYSHTPFFLTLSLSLLIPQMLFLNLLGAYSFYLFWAGIEYLTNLKEERKIAFIMLSTLVMILMYLLLTVIFNSIYDVVLNQFTTFTN